MEITSKTKIYKNRLRFILALLTVLLIYACGNSGKIPPVEALETSKIPVIDVTDTYHPYQDPGDNFDLIMAYALPEIDLKAIVFDITGEFLKPVADHPFLYNDPNGPREPGIIPVSQMNYIYNRNIPYGMAPFTPMKHYGDKMLEVPGFQQKGIELMLKTLQESPVPVNILSFGSARPVAVAYNRNPELFKRKVKQIHLSAGTASHNFELGTSESHNAIPGGEWNVALDSIAFVELLESDLPIAIYPCAARDGAYELGPHNSYWQLPNLEFINDMDPKLQSYLNFVFGRKLQLDFLQEMNKTESTDALEKRYSQPHHVWETAVWSQIANRELVLRNNGHYRLIPKREVVPSDRIIQNELKPCKIVVRSDGRFDFELTAEPSNFSIYTRSDPEENQKAMQEALPYLYTSFDPE